MKGYRGVILLIISSFLSILGLNTTRENQYEVLKEAFKQSKFEYREGKIKFSGIIGEEYISVRNLEGQLGEMILVYGKERQWVTSSSVESNKSEVHGLIDRDNFVLGVSMINAMYNNNWTTYLYIEIIVKDEAVEVKELTENVEESFKVYGIEPEVRICIDGMKTGELMEDEVTRLEETVLEILRMKKAEVYQNQNSHSIYGYSKRIGGYYVNPSSQKKMNVNIAFHYNEAENMTELYIATPLIDESY